MIRSNLVSHIPNILTNGTQKQHVKFLASRVETIKPNKTLPKQNGTTRSAKDRPQHAPHRPGIGAAEKQVFGQFILIT
jgi:hypothetical protein